jgi:hypothetical protein
MLNFKILKIVVVVQYRRFVMKLSFQHDSMNHVPMLLHIDLLGQIAQSLDDFFYCSNLNENIFLLHSKSHLS